jgi:hypothetical protein
MNLRPTKLILRPTTPSEDGWIYKGQTVIFRGVPEFYYPHFTNMKVDAEVLELGKEYTVSKSEVYSSWQAVWVEDFPDTMFNASFFTPK